MRNANDQLHYLQGKLDGIQEYAWWKDGVQYVGTCGTTLKEAMAVACIIDFHNKKSNMTLHCVEVVARRAVENINSRMGNREVRISDEDIT